ncbi:MAG TPA: protein-methionine-sulfoxide reductase catalytic subunit MsrP [Bryobacteraceae bacterium]|nr:protein-methionine-sulfoxide reductase catalytic subunit MsrP [Bryobacteraceae bacterium]
MLIKRAPDIPYSEITPKHLYLNRRSFLAGLPLAGAALAAGNARAEAKLEGVTKSPFSTTEKVTPYSDVTHYNNYYEFGTAKNQPASLAQKLKTSPWTVKVEGEVSKPQVLDIDAIMKMAPLEERIYRHRCVEAWSIVVPWIGFPLNALIKKVEPTEKAKFVAFQTVLDRGIMLSEGAAGIQLPYVEGLRMDEAMHPLAILCVGMYGEELPKQDGAPVRLVVPWKYGFKSIKSIVKIKFVEKQPPATWNITNAREYGFYSNVNPEVDHPRWSQASERRLGEFFRRKTLMFNGYGDQVAQLYAGMDLRKNY